MLVRNALHSTRITKVKVMLMMKWFDRVFLSRSTSDGNNHAGEAADLGRRHVDAYVMDGRMAFSQACHVWFPIVNDLHRFFIAVARAVDNGNEKGDSAWLPRPATRWTGGKGGLLSVLLGMIWLLGLFFVLGLSCKSCSSKHSICLKLLTLVWGLLW